MNIKSKAANVAAFAIGIGIMAIWPGISRPSYAAAAPAPEQYKICYLTNTGEDPDAELNKMSAEGWKFKAAIGTDKVLFYK